MIAATLSSVSPKPAPSSVSRSGTTSAQGLQSQATQPSHPCPKSSQLAHVPHNWSAPLTVDILQIGN